MLRRLRTAAGFTQERLAERCGISAAGVAALEAGRRTSPRLTTVGLLCDGLGVGAEERAALIAAATGGATAPGREQPSVAPNHQTAASEVAVRRGQHAFVGRAAELQALCDAWERRTRVALLFGEAGGGKSALAVELALDLAGRGVTVLRGRSSPTQRGR